MNGESVSVDVILSVERWVVMILKRLLILLCLVTCPVKGMRSTVIWLLIICAWYMAKILRMHVSLRKRVSRQLKLHKDSLFTTMVQWEYSVVRIGW